MKVSIAPAMPKEVQVPRPPWSRTGVSEVLRGQLLRAYRPAGPSFRQPDGRMPVRPEIGLGNDSDSGSGLAGKPSLSSRVLTRSVTVVMAASSTLSATPARLSGFGKPSRKSSGSAAISVRNRPSRLGSARALRASPSPNPGSQSDALG